MGKCWSPGHCRLVKISRIRAVPIGILATKPEPGDKIYPYLLRGMAITRPNQVWAMDITYITMARGFVYLAVVLDWFSRRVLSWRVSITMEAAFCVEAGDRRADARACRGCHPYFGGAAFAANEFLPLGRRSASLKARVSRATRCVASPPTSPSAGSFCGLGPSDWQEGNRHCGTCAVEILFRLIVETIRRPRANDNLPSLLRAIKRV